MCTRGWAKINESVAKRTRCVCETQMPPIMANFKDGQGHKDKYLHTSRKFLSHKNAHVQYETSKIYYLEVMTNVNLK